MSTSKQLTAAVTIKLKPNEAAALRREAERRGYTTLSPFLRQMLLDHLSTEPPSHLILQRILGFEHAWFEFVDVSLRDGGITPERMRQIRERANLVSPDLLAGLLHRHRAATKPERSTESE